MSPCMNKDLSLAYFTRICPSYVCVCVYFGQCWQTSSISLYNARVTIYPLLKLSLMTEVTLLMIILLFFFTVTPK